MLPYIAAPWILWVWGSVQLMPFSPNHARCQSMRDVFIDSSLVTMLLPGLLHQLDTCAVRPRPVMRAQLESPNPMGSHGNHHHGIPPSGRMGAYPYEIIGCICYAPLYPYEIPMRWQDNLPFSWFNPTVAHIFGASFPNFAILLAHPSG